MSTVLNPATPHSNKRGEPAWDIALLYPRQGEWTVAEYLSLDTNHLVELVDGCVEVLPMPVYPHQWIVRFLFRQLDRFVQANTLGETYFAPLPVRLWEGRFREPDILFLDNHRTMTKANVPDGADLVIEVVSEGKENRHRDLDVKRDEYAKAGIPEYWIVDPELKQITISTLNNHNYETLGVYKDGVTAASKRLYGFSIPVKDVFDVPENPAE